MHRRSEEANLALQTFSLRQIQWFSLALQPTRPILLDVADLAFGVVGKQA